MFECLAWEAECLKHLLGLLLLEMFDIYADHQEANVKLSLFEFMPVI